MKSRLKGGFLIHLLEDLLGFNLSVFPGVFYCHVGVYQVALLNLRFFLDQV